MPPKKSLEENMGQIQAKLNELAESQDAGQKGKIRTAINNIKNRFKKYTDAKQKKELDKRLTEMLKKNQSPEAKKNILDLISILRKTPTPTPPPGTPPGTPTPEPSSASSSGSATPQEDQPLLQKEEKEEKPKRGRGRPRKPRNPVGRPSNVQQLAEAEKKEAEQKENLELLMDAGVGGPDLAGEIGKMLGQPTERVKKEIEERKQQQQQKTKETKERKQQERKQQEKEQQQQQKQQEEAQLIQTVRESAQLTDNVNKAEEQGSNTQIITPEYLLRERPRVEIVESKYGVPPPNQRPLVNELMNDEVETVPDLINVNQNQTGINESTTRQREQDITSQESQLGFAHEQDKKRWEEQKRSMDERIEQMTRDIDGPLQADLSRIRNRNNPITSSSMPDNSNYRNRTEDKRSVLLDYAQELQFSDDKLKELSEMNEQRIDEVYNDYLNTIQDQSDDGDTGYYTDVDEDQMNREYLETFALETPGLIPSHEEQLGQRIRTLKGRSSGRGLLAPLHESQLGQRFGQIGTGAQAGAIAGARQGMRGGLRRAIEGGLEGGLRGGVAAGIAGQLGGGLAGQLAQMGAQEGISDILGRLRGLVSGGGDGDDGGDGADEIKRQIDNINQELGAIKDPLKYPEFKEKEMYRFPGPGEQKKSVQLVQNSVTEYLNDVNLYGAGYEYEPIMDL